MRSLLHRGNLWLSVVLVRYRVWWFILGVVLTVVSIPLAEHLTYNRSMEGFFPKSDTRLQLYLRNKAWFGGESTLIAAYTDPELWTATGMKRQHALADALRQLPGVLSVISLGDRPLPKPSLLDPFATIESVIEKQARPIDQLQQEVRETKLYDGVFVARDGATTALWLQIRFDTPEALAEGLERIRDTAREHIPGVAVAGTFMLIHDVYQHTERDGHILEVVAVVVMGLVIAVSFRSLRWVVLPLLICYTALYWSKGAWFLVRGELTMVSSAISSLVAVTGVATVVHFGLHYRELRGTYDSLTAMRLTFETIGPAVFWILATNGTGFGALLVCELKPVTDFAWIMVIASAFIGVSAMCFLPLGMTAWQRAVHGDVTGAAVVSGSLNAMLRWVQRRPLLTALGLIVPSCVVGLGMLWLEPQTDFTGNFKKHTEIYRAYDFIETRMSGAGQLDLVWDAPDLLALPKAELDAHLSGLRKLERELGELPGVTKVLGIVDFLDFLDGLMGKGTNMKARLLFLDGKIEAGIQELDPLTRRLLPASAVAKLKGQAPIAPLFWNMRESKMRVTMQVRERLSSEVKQALIAAAEARAAENLGAGRQPQTTGIYVMLTHLIYSLLNDQNKTFVLSLVLQFVSGWLAFRSIWLALVAMVPTVLPVVAVVGTMGWVGLPVNIATAMLASVAMGMTIDSSILYIYRFQQEVAAGADFDTALARTHGTAGVAVVLSNLALVLGFAVLALSSFIPLVHFGIFTSLAMLGGMLGNLILLPLLMNLVRRFIVKPRPVDRP
jgi:predicted RND superfamily exporter protein